MTTDDWTADERRGIQLLFIVLDLLGINDEKERNNIAQFLLQQGRVRRGVV